MKQPSPEPVLYYIQNKGYVGNSLLFWRKGGHGYTTNLDEAWKVTGPDAKRICRSRPTEDFPIAVEIADHIAIRAVEADALRAVQDELRLAAGRAS